MTMQLLGNVMTGATDPEGRPVRLVLVEGSEVPQNTPLALVKDGYGLVCYSDGSVFLDYDTTTATLPADGVTENSVTSITCRCTDGALQSADETYPIHLTGEAGVSADVTPPVPASLTPASGSTGQSVNAVIYLVYSEAVAFGSSGTIDIWNETTDALIEQFDVTTDVGTGPGSIGITADQLRIEPSTALPESTEISVRVSASAIEDLAGNADATGITDGSWSFTTGAVAAPVSAFQFGSDTPAAQAGFTVNTFVADTSGHFEKVGNRVVVSAAGVGNLSGDYSVTIDGQVETISIVPNAIHVSTHAELSTALSLVNQPANKGTDWQIIIRDGSVITNGGAITISGVTMAGTFFDPNSSGYSIVSAALYDTLARASVTGGSVTITCDTVHGATWADRLALNTCNRVLFRFVDFAWHPTVDAHNIAGGSSNPAQSKLEMITATGNGTYGDFIFDQCRFGAPAGTPATRYPSIFEPSGVGRVYFQDCTFDRFFYAMIASNVRRMASRGNLFLRRINDIHRSWGRRSGTTGSASTPVYFDMCSNTEMLTLGYAAGDGAFHWLNEHADNGQWASSNNSTAPLVFHSEDNYYYSPVNQADYTAEVHAYYDGTNGRPDYTGRDFSGNPRQTQGIHTGGNSGATGAYVRDVFIGSSISGVTHGSNAQMQMTNCLVFESGEFDRHFNAKWRINLSGAPAGPVTISGVTSNLIGLTTHANYDVSDLVVVDPRSLSAMQAAFSGVFVDGGKVNAGVDFSAGIDLTDAASLRASIQSVFAAKPGGPAVGWMPWD